MLIELHTHTPTHREAVPPTERQPNAQWRPDRVVDAAVSWADYMAAMQLVDRACVFGIRLKGGQMPAGREGAGVQWTGDVNADTAAFARAYPDKLVGFMSVHPDEGDPVSEIERCASDLGLNGIKLGPNYQGFDPLGAPARRVYETAQRMRLPIVFHQGTSPMRTAPIRYAHPLIMDEIAVAFPELRIVMAHMGHPWHADTIAVIRMSTPTFRPTSTGRGNCTPVCDSRPSGTCSPKLVLRQRLPRGDAARDTGRHARGQSRDSGNGVAAGGRGHAASSTRA